ncbi:MAG: hypothetical protein NTX57_19400 [Armatimonadetes bacterium]|jgi:hypothetical protein|nr:hypothetical protein [Armatimonadota bacterium]
MPETDSLHTNVWERFAQLYGTPERIARLWEQWMATQTESSIAFLEKALLDSAEANKITLEEARTRLVLEKLVEDRGPRFVEKFLREHDQASKPLKPMSVKKKR